MASVISGTVEVCVFRVDARVPNYLLVKRSADEELYPGMWQIVTGKIRTSERAVDAARRELVEETGLTPRNFWIVPYVDTFYVAADDAVQLSPFFAAEVDGGSEPKLSREHEDHSWCTLEEAANTLIWPGQRQGLRIVHEYIIGGRKASRLLSVPV